MYGPGRISLSFLKLWIGNTASGLATWALPFVLGLSVLDGEMTAAELGMTLAARTIGFLAAVPVAGVFSDRLGPRRVILVSSVMAAIGILIIAMGLLLATTSGMVLLSVGACIAGIGQGACRPSYQAIVPKFVRADRLQPANAVMSIAVRGTSLIGPALAVAMEAAFGSRAALVGIAVLWIVSALLPPFMANGEQRTTPTSIGAREFVHRFVADLAEGGREAFLHPWFVAGLAALTTVIATSYSVTAIILPEFSRDVFGGPLLLTMCVTANTLGALIGAAVISRWRPASRGWVALFGLALCSLVPLSLLAPTNLVVPVAAFFAAGLGIEIFNVSWFTAVQTEVPPEKLSRVSSLDFVFSYGLAPIGLALLAPAADLFGRDIVLLVCGALSLVGPAWAACVATSRTFSRSDDELGRHSSEAKKY